MSRQEKNDIFKTLAFLEVGIWVVSILYKAVKIFFLPPNIKNIATSIPEYDSPKDAKYLGCLKTICKVLAWFIGGFSVIGFIIAASIDREAWKPSLTFGIFAVLFYLFSKSIVVKDVNDMVLLEGGNCKKCKKNNSLKIELPDSLQINESINNFSTTANSTEVLPQESDHFIQSATTNRIAKPQKRIGMLIVACFFAYHFVAFLLCLIADITFLIPAIVTGILTFMFIMLARSPKTEKYIGKLPKPIFVLICILAMIISGTVITRLTNQTTDNKSNLQNQSNAQTTSVIKQQAESLNINHEMPSQKK